MNIDSLLGGSPHSRSFSEWERLLYIEGHPLHKGFFQLEDPSRTVEAEPIQKFILDRDALWKKQIEDVKARALEEITAATQAEFAEKVIKEVGGELKVPIEKASLRALIDKEVEKINQAKKEEKE